MRWLGDRVLAGPLPRFWRPGGRWFNGKRRLIRRAMMRRRVDPVAVNEEATLCTVLGRYRLHVDPDDLSLSPHLLRDGMWEMWVTEALAELLGPRTAAVDVGANVGYFTMIMADLCRDGRVDAFEPNPRVAERLQRSLHANGFAERVTCHPEPLGDEDGCLLHLVVPDRHDGGGHLVTAEAAAGRPTLMLATRRLDGVPGAQDAELVKIDAEGSEPAIWRGMARMIAGTRLHTVLIEFAPERHPDPAAFLAEVTERGFALGYIHESRGMLSATADEILNDRSVRDRMLLLRR